MAADWRDELRFNPGGAGRVDEPPPPPASAPVKFAPQCRCQCCDCRQDRCCGGYYCSHEEEAGAQEGQGSDRFERDDAEAQTQEADVAAIARQLKGHRGTSPVAKREQLEDLVRYVLHLARWQR